MGSGRKREAWRGLVGGWGVGCGGVGLVGGGALGEFTVGEEVGGAAQIVFEGDGRVALTVAGESATLGIAEQLLAAGGGRLGARGLADLDQFDVLGCDGVAGANAATLTLAAVVVAAVVSR